MEDDDERGAGEEMKASKLEAQQRPGEADGQTDLQKIIDAERRKSDDYLSKLKYLQADFENYRKRIEREMRELEDFSITKMTRRLLPVVDELELAIQTAEKGAVVDQVLEGMKMVQKNLLSALEGEGLRRIEALGKPFDPALHEAVEKVAGEREGDDVVVEVIRSGFTLKGRVLRPCLVKVEVARRQEGGSSNPPEKEGEVA